ncbi:hypothetical protein GPECTOR_7g1257 [Gonium pectorale]|uniref:BTB domain-containing protein n=1 Tax=Gonium pectorale TaxID=33097 RepID=A0A150GU66_GONPE|nr:hypothetical protein GPECTOR_7g1257 [Gonium pectorale]|eukprot:KXZ53361.1 hypothetical protein GPECTOR_7g1257 [Gonium pectorale]
MYFLLIIAFKAARAVQLDKEGGDDVPADRLQELIKIYREDLLSFDTLTDHLHGLQLQKCEIEEQMEVMESDVMAMAAHGGGGQGRARSSSRSSKRSKSKQLQEQLALPLSELRKIAFSVLHALRAMNAKGYALKPENVLPLTGARSSDRSSVYSGCGSGAGGHGGGYGGTVGAAGARLPAVSTLQIQISADGGPMSASRSRPRPPPTGEEAPSSAEALWEANGGGGGGSGGSGGSRCGSGGGEGGLSALQAPVGIAVDCGGVAYIADTGHCRVLRVVLDSGEAVVLAGGGGYGHRDGPGRKAKFASPMYLAIDHRDGSLVVSDQHCLRRVASDGFVTTIAGSTTPGHADGPASTARFYNLRGVAVDADGNVFAADSSNHCVSPGNAGFRDGAGSDARFRNPCGLAYNLQDSTLVVADSENNRLRRLDRERLVTTIAGDGLAGPPGPRHADDAPALAAHLNHPQGVAVDGDGNVLLCDLDNRCVRLVTPGGAISTLAGGPGAAGDDEAGPSTSTPASALATIGGGGAAGGAPSSFCDPQGIAVTHRGEVLVVECSANRVRLISARLHSPHTYLAATKSTFVADMNGLLARGEGADVTFLVGGEEMRAHKWLLAARCDAFGRMLGCGGGGGGEGGGFVESRSGVVEVRDCSAAAFREFLRYLYTDVLEFKGDVVLDVLLLGRKYMVGRVFQHCCSQVRRGLCGSNALALLSWADEHRVEELRPVVFSYVLQHLRHILRKYPASLTALEARPDLLMQLLVAQAAAEGGAAAAGRGGGAGGAGGAGAGGGAGSTTAAAVAAAAAAAAGGGGAAAMAAAVTGALGGGGAAGH